ncbi:hypothetical protein IV203_034571 [Nitzschia inconspicua]|uniref:Uncharacterized protein n=1 Tax=Nitzschia inconspicua TaxID=303405 RepID=A0A9K3PU23_9STRA|nr:hypothetical protein IV203_034571 [Nitzschia inconspicua]
MVKIVPMLLMPISNGVSWYLICKKSPGGDQAYALLQNVWKIALFYMVWALYNKYLNGRPQELGHISTGLLALTAYFQKKYLAMGACGLVVLNFAVVIPVIINKGPGGMAKLVYKEVTALSLTWAYIFIAYILSNVVLWSFVLYRLYQEVVVPTQAGGSTGGGSYVPVADEEAAAL